MSGESGLMDVLHTVQSTRSVLGGTSRSVTGLCSALAAEGVSVRLLACATPGAQSILPSDQVETIFVREVRDRFGMFWPINYHRTLSRQIRARRPDVVHDHGVWRVTNWSAATIAARCSV